MTPLEDCPLPFPLLPWPSPHSEELPQPISEDVGLPRAVVLSVAGNVAPVAVIVAVFGAPPTPTPVPFAG